MDNKDKNKKEIIERMVLTPGELHVRENQDGTASRTIYGYAILFNTLSAPMWETAEEVAYEKISPAAITKEFLDGCDIKLTMFHDRQLILGRSNKGEGTLSYKVDAKGVYFECEVAKTVDGDKALELVSRGDIAGCSFAFSTRYYDKKYVSKSIERVDGKTVITYQVDVITRIYDFTLAADPAYPDTECATREREFISSLRETKDNKEQKIQKQLSEMRRAASVRL